MDKNLKLIKMNDKLLNVKLVGKSMTISGWGYTHDNPKTKSPILMKVTNPIVKTDVVVILDGRHHANKLRMLQMNQDGGRSACSGDSGGIRLLISQGSLEESRV